MDFSLDARGSEYPSVSNRDPRITVYDAWVGGRIAEGKLAVRLGQMYVNDLGSLGGVGGLSLEARAGKVRFGLFGGLEPKGFDAGYVPDVKKGGIYVAYEGPRGLAKRPRLRDDPEPERRRAERRGDVELHPGRAEVLPLPGRRVRPDRPRRPRHAAASRSCS